MHRRKTRFAQRITRVASALERRGVIATYELHDRVLTNRGARRRLAHEPPALDETQQRIVDELRVEGFCVVPFTELVPDPARWAEVEAGADRFVAETEDGLAREAAGEAGALRRTGKDFVLRKYAFGVTMGPDDPWLRLAVDQRLLDLANAYLGLWSKLEYVDLWYNLPSSGDAERRASQRWHRDFNDRHLLKAFVYLVDVDEETGPFEYVPRSAPGGELADLWPWGPMNETYPPQEELAARLEGKRIETFTGPKGTVILCNTSGFHRGGFVTGKPRVLATFTYASPAALKALSMRNFTYQSGNGGELPGPVRYALS
jgi:hypothetical protein